MFKQSVISKTGQMWAFYGGVLALIFGSVAPLFEQTGIGWTAGTVIAVAGYGFTALFVKCPACGQKWLAKALMYAEMYGPLFKTSACPGCKKDFG